MTSKQHVHHETKVLPVRPHGVSRSQPPLRPPWAQTSRPTLQPTEYERHTAHSYETEVSSHFESLPTTKETYKKALKGLHTQAVQRTISSYPPNRIPQTKPPEISPDEENLRRERAGLSRLRSGFRTLLNSYMSRIDD